MRGQGVAEYRSDYFEGHRKFELDSSLQFCLMEGPQPKPKAKRPTGKLLKTFRNKHAALLSAALYPEAYVWDTVLKCVVSSERG